MVSSVPVSARARDALARRGEDLAARYLRREGMRVLARNWRCGEGELDLVARWGRTIVVAEVKTRTGLRFGTPLDAVTAAKRRRLRRLGRRWAAAHRVAGAPLRVDVVSVLTGRGGRAYVLHHRGVA